MSDAIFGELSKLEEIKENVTSAKSSAAAALSEAQSLRNELGTEGQSPSTYDRLKTLETALEELKTAARTISESQVETGNLASEILDSLSNFVNESAKAIGLEGGELSVEGLTPQDAMSEEKVFGKLDEINAKITAIKESIETDEVVVKTWFEGSE
jgi:ribonuclease D